MGAMRIAAGSTDFIEVSISGAALFVPPVTGTPGRTGVGSPPVPGTPGTISVGSTTTGGSVGGASVGGTSSGGLVVSIVGTVVPPAVPVETGGGTCTAGVGSIGPCVGVDAPGRVGRGMVVGVLISLPT